MKTRRYFLDGINYSYLQTEVFSVIKSVENLFRYSRLFGICLGANPDIDDPSLVLRIKGHFEDITETTVKQTGVQLYLYATPVEAGAVGP